MQKNMEFETEVIPGISSATALATAQKIPLTKRGITESVWITTGTTSCGKLSEDIELAAQSTATVVILMGIGKLGGNSRSF
jgi:uroporphyrin-III C-methyltransferase